IGLRFDGSVNEARAGKYPAQCEDEGSASRSKNAIHVGSPCAPRKMCDFARASERHYDVRLALLQRDGNLRAVAPLRGCKRLTRSRFRWYRCAQPPANCCEAFGFSAMQAAPR